MPGAPRLRARSLLFGHIVSGLLQRMLPYHYRHVCELLATSSCMLVGACDGHLKDAAWLSNPTRATSPSHLGCCLLTCLVLQGRLLQGCC